MRCERAQGAGSLITCYAFRNSGSSLIGVSTATGRRTTSWSILALGLFNSIIFPAIFALGIARGSGLLIAAISLARSSRMCGDGSPIWPASAFTTHISCRCCYLYISFYGFIRSKPKQVANAAYVGGNWSRGR